MKLNNSAIQLLMTIVVATLMIFGIILCVVGGIYGLIEICSFMSNYNFFSLFKGIIAISLSIGIPVGFATWIEG